MKYEVKQTTLEDYLQLKISDQDLFPNGAPSGTSYYDLKPEKGEAHIVKFEHVENAIKMYMSNKIAFEAFSEWIDSIIALDLFRFDDSDEDTLDRVAGLTYFIDDLKDGVNQIDLNLLKDILNKYKNET